MALINDDYDVYGMLFDVRVGEGQLQAIKGITHHLEEASGAGKKLQGTMFEVSEFLSHINAKNKKSMEWIAKGGDDLVQFTAQAQKAAKEVLRIGDNFKDLYEKNERLTKAQTTMSAAQRELASRRNAAPQSEEDRVEETRRAQAAARLLATQHSQARALEATQQRLKNMTEQVVQMRHQAQAEENRIPGRSAIDSARNQLGARSHEVYSFEGLTEQAQMLKALSGNLAQSMSATQRTLFESLTAAAQHRQEILNQRSQATYTNRYMSVQGGVADEFGRVLTNRWGGHVTGKGSDAASRDVRDPNSFNTERAALQAQNVIDYHAQELNLAKAITGRWDAANKLVEQVEKHIAQRRSVNPEALVIERLGSQYEAQRALSSLRGQLGDPDPFDKGGFLQRVEQARSRRRAQRVEPVRSQESIAAAQHEDYLRAMDIEARTREENQKLADRANVVLREEYQKKREQQYQERYGRKPPERMTADELNEMMGRQMTAGDVAHPKTERQSQLVSEAREDAARELPELTALHMRFQNKFTELNREARRLDSLLGVTVENGREVIKMAEGPGREILEKQRAVNMIARSQLFNDEDEERRKITLGPEVVARVRAMKTQEDQIKALELLEKHQNYSKTLGEVGHYEKQAEILTRLNPHPEQSAEHAVFEKQRLHDQNVNDLETAKAFQDAGMRDKARILRNAVGQRQQDELERGKAALLEANRAAFQERMARARGGVDSADAAISGGPRKTARELHEDLLKESRNAIRTAFPIKGGSGAGEIFARGGPNDPYAPGTVPGSSAYETYLAAERRLTRATNKWAQSREEADKIDSRAAVRMTALQEGRGIAQTKFDASIARLDAAYLQMQNRADAVARTDVDKLTGSARSAAIAARDRALSSIEKQMEANQLIGGPVGPGGIRDQQGGALYRQLQLQQETSRRQQKSVWEDLSRKNAATESEKTEAERKVAFTRAQFQKAQDKEIDRIFSRRTETLQETGMRAQMVGGRAGVTPEFLAARQLQEGRLAPLGDRGFLGVTEPLAETSSRSYGKLSQQITDVNNGLDRQYSKVEKVRQAELTRLALYQMHADVAPEALQPQVQAAFGAAQVRAYEAVGAARARYEEAEHAGVARLTKARTQYTENFKREQLAAEKALQSSNAQTMLNIMMQFAAAISMVKNFVTETVQYAARTETMKIVTEQMTIVNNINTQAVLQQISAIRSLNITTQEAHGVVQRMIFAQLDVAKATQLARVAQDAATISGENSSETLNKIITGIVTGQTRILHYMGLQVSMQQTLRQLRAELGREPTEIEKRTAMLNAVLSEGVKISGNYESAMLTAGKQVLSLKRQFQEAQNAIGQEFQPAYMNVISMMSRFANAARENSGEFALLTRAVAGLATAFLALQTINFTMLHGGGFLKGIKDSVLAPAEAAVAGAAGAGVVGKGAGLLSRVKWGPLGLVAAAVGLGAYVSAQSGGSPMEGVQSSVAATKSQQDMDRRQMELQYRLGDIDDKAYHEAMGRFHEQDRALRRKSIAAVSQVWIDQARKAAETNEVLVRDTKQLQDEILHSGFLGGAKNFVKNIFTTGIPAVWNTLTWKFLDNKYQDAGFSVGEYLRGGRVGGSRDPQEAFKISTDRIRKKIREAGPQIIGDEIVSVEKQLEDFNAWTKAISANRESKNDPLYNVRLMLEQETTNLDDIINKKVDATKEKVRAITDRVIDRAIVDPVEKIRFKMEAELREHDVTNTPEFKAAMSHLSSLGMGLGTTSAKYGEYKSISNRQEALGLTSDQIASYRKAKEYAEGAGVSVSSLLPKYDLGGLEEKIKENEAIEKRLKELREGIPAVYDERTGKLLKEKVEPDAALALRLNTERSAIRNKEQMDQMRSAFETEIRQEELTRAAAHQAKGVEFEIGVAQLYARPGVEGERAAVESSYQSKRALEIAQQRDRVNSNNLEFTAEKLHLKEKDAALLRQSLLTSETLTLSRNLVDLDHQRVMALEQINAQQRQIMLGIDVERLQTSMHAQEIVLSAQMRGDEQRLELAKKIHDIEVETAAKIFAKDQNRGDYVKRVDSADATLFSKQVDDARAKVDKAKANAEEALRAEYDHRDRLIKAQALGPLQEMTAARRIFELKKEHIQRLFELEQKAEDGKKAGADDEAKRDRALADANVEYFTQRMDLMKKQREEGQKMAGEVFNAMLAHGQGGVGTFVRGIFKTTEEQVFKNVFGDLFTSVGKHVTIPGQGTADKPTFLGKILQGTMFGIKDDPTKDIRDFNERLVLQQDKTLKSSDAISTTNQQLVTALEKLTDAVNVLNGIKAPALKPDLYTPDFVNAPKYPMTGLAPLISPKIGDYVPPKLGEGADIPYVVPPPPLPPQAVKLIPQDGGRGGGKIPAMRGGRGGGYVDPREDPRNWVDGEYVGPSDKLFAAKDFYRDIDDASRSLVRDAGVALGISRPIGQAKYSRAPIYGYNRPGAREAGYTSPEGGIFVNVSGPQDLNKPAIKSVIRHEDAHALIAPYLGELTSDKQLSGYTDRIRQGLVSSYGALYNPIGGLSASGTLSEGLAYGSGSPNVPGLTQDESSVFIGRAESVLGEKHPKIARKLTRLMAERQAIEQAGGAGGGTGRSAGDRLTAQAGVMYAAGIETWDDQQLAVQKKLRIAAAKYGVPAEEALGLAQSESGFRQIGNAEGSGAYGVMQLTESALKDMGVPRSDYKATKLDLDRNIDLGVGYYAKVRERNKGNVDKTIYDYKGVAAGGAKESDVPLARGMMHRWKNAPGMFARDSEVSSTTAESSGPPAGTDYAYWGLSPDGTRPLSKTTEKTDLQSGLNLAGTITGARQGTPAGDAMAVAGGVGDVATIFGWDAGSGEVASGARNAENAISLGKSRGATGFAGELGQGVNVLSTIMRGRQGLKANKIKDKIKGGVDFPKNDPNAWMRGAPGYDPENPDAITEEGVAWAEGALNGTGGAGGPSKTAKAVGTGMEVAAGGFMAYDAVKSFGRGGAQGALSGTQDLLGIASMIPGPQQPFVAGAAMAVGMVKSLLGDPREKYKKEIEKRLKQMKYSEADTIQETMNTSGQRVDFDFMNRVREGGMVQSGPLSSLPDVTYQNLLAANQGRQYGPTPAAGTAGLMGNLQYTDASRSITSTGGPAPGQPVNLNVNVSTMDSRSFNDNSAKIADAMRGQLLLNHPISNDIRQISGA